MKLKLILVISLSMYLSLAGQESIDILTVSGRYGFPQTYDSTYTGKAKEIGAMVNLVAPIKFNEKTIWYNSLNYFHFNVSNDEVMPADNANPIVLNGFILRTGLYQKFSRDRGLQIFFAPRFMSDFNNIDGNHFQFGGMAMYEKKFRDNLTMSFGAMYNQELFGPYLVPLINLTWKLSDKWEIAGLAPVYLKVKYKVNDAFTVGFSHFGLITSYALGDPEYKGDYIQRSSIDLSLFARLRIVENLYIEGRFGRSFGRSYAQYEADQKVKFAIPLVAFGDERVQKNVTFNDGLIANLRLVYNVPIPTDE